MATTDRDLQQDMEHILIKYEGEALKDHRIDVDILGPSLISLSSLLKRANYILNENRAEVRLDISADIEANCVTIDLSIVSTWYEYIKSLVGQPDVITAKEIAEWIGIITGSTFSVWGLIRFLKGKETTSIININIGTVNITIIEDGVERETIEVPEKIYKLVQDTLIRKYSSGSLKPLESADIDSMSFYKRKDDPEPIVIDKDYARDIQEAILPAVLIPDARTFRAELNPVGPYFGGPDRSWRFIWEDSEIRADVSKTDIAARARDRGSHITDVYVVEMELSYELSDKGNLLPRYKIERVLDFTPGERHPTLFDDTN